MKRHAPTRCALYLRVSTEQQTNGNSLATQESLLLRHAKARGYAVADIYVDAGLSGKNTNRPELQRLLGDAARRSFDVVLVWAVDRISRSVPDLLRLIDTLREHDVGFTAISQDFDTSDPAGSLTFHILGSFAQFERELLVERTKEGHIRRLRHRDWSCGPAPLGYRKVNGKLVEVPEEAALVRRIFRLFLELKSYRAVAAQLNAQGVRRRQGKHWHGNVIKGIVSNPIYSGANVYGRHASGDTRLKPRDQWMVVPGMREPMVDTDTFEAAQKLIGASKTGKQSPSCAPSLLTGLARCGKCMSPMYVSTSRREGRAHRYYRCSGNAHLGKAFCPGEMVPADRLEKVVMAQVQKVAEQRRNTLPSQQTEQPDDSTAEERRQLQNALERVKYRISRMFELYETGELGKAAFGERMEKLSVERRGVQDALAAMRAEVTPSGEDGQAEVSIGSLDEEGRREVMRAAIREVIVRGRTAELVMADLRHGDEMRFTLSVLPELDTTTLGGRLKKARLEAGLEQRDLADLLGVHLQCISNWEIGKTRPRRLAITEIEHAIASREVPASAIA